MDLQVVLDASTRGMSSFVQMATSLAGIKAAAEATGSSLDDTKASVDSTSSSMGLLNRANVDLASRFKETRTQVDNVRQALVSHGVASRDATTATKGLFDQLARKGVLSDLRTAFADAGVSVRGMGSQLSAMSGALVDAQKAAEESTPILSGLGNAMQSVTSAVGGALGNLPIVGGMFSSIGESAGSLGAVSLPLLAVAIATVAVALAGAVGILGTFLALAVAATVIVGGFAVGLAALAVTLGLVFGGFGLIAGAITLLAVQTGSVNGPLKTFQDTWSKVADTLGKAAAPGVAALFNAIDQLAPAVQQLALQWINWYNSISPQFLSDAMSVVRIFLGVLQQMTPQLQALANTFLSMWPSIQPLFQNLATFGAQVLVSLLTHLLQISVWFLQTMPTAGPIVSQIFDKLGQLVQQFGTWGAQAVNFFIQHWPQITSVVNDLINVFRLMGPILQILWGLFLQLWGMLMQNKDTIEGLKLVALAFGLAFVVTMGSIGIAVLAAAGTLTALGAAFNTMSSVGQSAVGAIGAAFDRLGSNMNEALVNVSNIINSFDQYVNALPVIGGWFNLPPVHWGSTGGASGTAGGPGTFGQAQAFARGGIVTNPTLGVVGEAGPEAIIPLGGGPGNSNALNLWAQAGQALGVHGLGAGPNMTPGTWGGQCVVFVEAVTGVHYPVAFAAQMASYVNSATPAPGEIFVSTIPPYGHTGIVLSGNQVLDSNWGLNELIQIHCVARGTEISTEFGLVPIEDVQVGERVWTRQGLKPVTWSGLTRPRAEVLKIVTADGSVAVTPDHRIWVEDAHSFSTPSRLDHSLVLEDGDGVGDVRTIGPQSLTEFIALGENGSNGEVVLDELAQSRCDYPIPIGVHSDSTVCLSKTGSTPSDRMAISFRVGHVVGMSSRTARSIRRMGWDRTCHFKHLQGHLATPVAEPGQQQFGHCSDIDCSRQSPTENRLPSLFVRSKRQELSVAHDVMKSSDDILIGHAEAHVRDSVSSGFSPHPGTLTLKESSRPSNIGGFIPNSPSAFAHYDPYHTDSRWVRADNLQAGDSILFFAGDEFVVSPVTSVEVAETIDTYDLEVRDAHEFVAGGLLVANSLSDIPDIVGYISGVPMSGLPAGTTLDVSSAMSGLVSRALGGAGGLVGSIANGMLQLIIQGAKSKVGAGGIPGLGGGGRSAPTPSMPLGGGRGQGMGSDRIEALLASIDRKLATIAGAPSVGGLAAAQRIG